VRARAHTHAHTQEAEACEVAGSDWLGDPFKPTEVRAFPVPAQMWAGVSPVAAEMCAEMGPSSPGKDAAG
jgi:hypothetical protein